MAHPLPLVLVPGLNCTNLLWAPQQRALGAHAAISIADIASDDSIEGMAQRLLASAPPRFAVAGLSMGCYVVFELLRQAPERIDRAALLDGDPSADSDKLKALRDTQIARVENGQFLELVEGLWPYMVHPGRRDDAALRGTVDAMAKANGAAAFIRQLRALKGRRDYRDGLSQIKVPTLIMVGDSDRMTPPALSRAMHEAIAGSNLIEVGECGHLTTLERPDSVNAAMQGWLEIKH